MDQSIVEVRGGRLYVPASVYERELAAFASVALLARDGSWWLIPLKAGAGGLQLKQRSSRGDRVVEVQEFLRAHGVDDAQAPMFFQMQFDPKYGAFRLARVESSQ